MTAVLYILTVVIWGTTWLAISMQVGEAPIEVSILYRFALASILMFLILLLSRKLQKLSRTDHFFTLLQGCCLFCFNFYCFYSAIHYINSGLASVVFSVATITNCIFNWLLYKKVPTAKVLVGSLIGLLGICLLFLPEFSSDKNWTETLKGIGFAALGTVFFSLGNMISYRHQTKGIKPPTTNAWGMLYGVVAMFLLISLQGVSFSISWKTEYIASLVYLAIPGSVVAFTTYLMLILRIGADRAAYATVMFPAVALTLSSIYEGYHWSFAAMVGFCLVAIGNIVIFIKRPSNTLSWLKP
ncbi:EamA family transporter [Endozoicomonas sp. OPT23]|nr:EamA family transporter [Endozoicomonas sp. OPT23]